MLQATETICLHKTDRDMSNVPSKVRKGAQYHQTIQAVKSHSCALPTFQIWYRRCIAQPLKRHTG